MKFDFRSVLACAGLAAFGTCAPAQEIPVASIMSHTGPTAFAGVPVNNGIRLAFEQANQSGAFGSAKVKLIEGDYAGDKGQAINLANQAIKRDKVVLSYGPNTTGDSIAAGPVFNDGKTPMYALATSPAVLATGPWAFKAQQASIEQLPLLSKYVIDKTKVRKIAIVYDRTNDGMIDHKNLFRDPFKTGGGTVTSEEGLASNETNFLPLVTKIMSQNVDGVFMSLYAEQAGNLMVQLRQAGMGANVRFFGNTAMASPRVIAIAGKAAEGAVAVSEFIAGLEKNKAFEAAYKARYNVDADSWAAIGYTMGLVGVRAIKDAGPSPTQEKVREAFMKIRDVAVPVGSGTYSLNDRNPAYGAVIVQVKDGKFVAAP